MLINTHIHILNKNHIPDKFLPLKLNRLLAKTKISRIFSRILNYMLPFSNNDLLDRYAAFIRHAIHKNQEEVFKEIYKKYVSFLKKENLNPLDLKFLILTMDMTYMEAGKIKNSYEDQLKELANLKMNSIFSDCILPFMFLDPRRKNLLELVMKYIPTKLFNGAKVYPAIGYFPDDDRLSYIYYLLEKHNCPVISHCSRGGIYYRKMKQKECEIFSNPREWIPVLENYPDLKICLAHFGGEKDWKDFFKGKKNDNWFFEIIELMKKYKNLYTDISYTLYKKEYFPILKILLQDKELNKKVLYGTDWYMNSLDTKEKTFFSLKQYLSEYDFKLITEKNPIEFFIKNQ